VCYPLRDKDGYLVKIDGVVQYSLGFPVEVPFPSMLLTNPPNTITKERMELIATLEEENDEF
jgi:hypothetical protein